MTTSAPSKAYERSLLDWVKQQGAGANIDSDYSKGFSGTSMDTLLEKGFADMMRGVGGAGGQDKSPFPRRPCSCAMTEDGEHGPGCVGRWLRTLNSQGTCYVYVHTISHEIRGSQPPSYVSAAALDAQRLQRNETALGGRWHAFPSVHLEEWREEVARIVGQEGKTPLLLVDELDTYTALLSKISQPGGAELVDTRPLVLPVARTGVKFPDAFATMVARIGDALRGGRPVVLDLQDTSPHWLDKLCSVPKYRNKFPEQVFNPRAQAWQKEHVAAAAPGFALVLLSTLNPKEAESDLKDKVPWQLIKGVRVTSFIPAHYTLLPDLKRALDSARKRRRTPLLLDTTPEHSVDTFLAYQRTQQVDVPQLLSSARSVEEMREVLRARLVLCMKAGDALLLRLKDSCPDFLDTLCSEDSFPLAAFSCGAVQEEALMQRLFKEEEREHGVCVCREGFRVVLTSWRPVSSFAADLKLSLPLHNCDVFAVEHEPSEATDGQE